MLQFQATPDTDLIRDAVAKVSPGAVIQTYGDPKANKVLVRISQEAPESDLDAPARAVRQALADSYSQNPVTESSSEIVGPLVGAELRQKAVLLTGLGLLFQLVYIAWRFKGGVWGTSAAIAALHDVLVCLAFLALLPLRDHAQRDRGAADARRLQRERHDRDLRPRAREPAAPPQGLDGQAAQRLAQPDAHPHASSRTARRSWPVLGLFLFGGEVLRGFGFTMVVGIVVGTYSTLFIAVPLVNWWSLRQAPNAKPARAA